MFKHARFVLPTLVSIGLSFTAYAQAPFEGVVTMKMSGAGDAGEITQSYKGGKSRTDVASRGESAAMIMDMATGTMTMLMPPQKMYMVMDLRAMGAAARGLGAGRGGERGQAAAGAPPKITATGRTETVAGYTCEWYTMGEKDETEVCAAKGLGFFAFGQSPMSRGGASMGALAGLGANAQLVNAFKDGFFPLKLATNQGGKKQTVMEVTKVEKKTLDASLFSPPSDYTEMKMPGFGR